MYKKEEDTLDSNSTNSTKVESARFCMKNRNVGLITNDADQLHKCMCELLGNVIKNYRCNIFEKLHRPNFKLQNVDYAL